MASSTLFIVMVVFAIILLFVLTIAASIAANDLASSSLFNNNSNIRSAHQYLTFAAVLGACLLIILAVVFGVAFAMGAFTIPLVSDAVFNNPVHSSQVDGKAKAEELKLTNTNTASTVILVVLGLVGITVFIVGILAAIAATKIGQAPGKDSKASSAYTAAVVAAVGGIGTFALVIIAFFAYLGIRAYREEIEVKLKSYLAAPTATTNTTPANTIVVPADGSGTTVPGAVVVS